jgi:hypothetical protein
MDTTNSTLRSRDRMFTYAQRDDRQWPHVFVEGNDDKSGAVVERIGIEPGRHPPNGRQHGDTRSPGVLTRFSVAAGLQEEEWRRLTLISETVIPGCPAEPQAA